MDADRLWNVRATLARSVEEGAFPGGVWGVARHGETVALEAFGRRDTDPEAPATVDTVYDLASVTKPVACATAAMLLVERGDLHALDEARTFFPDRPLPHWAGIQVKHLLTHTSGLPDWTCAHADGDGEEAVMARIFAEEMKAAPGARYEYSCLGYITLGKIVERIAGEPLDALTAREVFAPLKMDHTGYRRISSTPNASPEDDIAPTKGGDRDRGKLYGQVHDGNASALDGVSGNAGLFGTASDLLRFGRMLTNQVDPEIGGHTWGFFCAPNPMHPSGDLLPDGAAGHTGFTGTSLLVHPDLDLAAVLLTNRVLGDSALHIRARRLFHNTLATAILA